jgi:hypothetical protein
MIVTQNYFPTVWKQAAVVPVFKQGNTASAINYRSISILNTLSKIFELVVHDHVSHYTLLKV